MEDCLMLIKEDFPAIDTDIGGYVSAVLESTSEDLEAVDDVYDGIGELLHGVDPAKTEEEVRELCARLCFVLKPNWTERATLEPPTVQRVFAIDDCGDSGQRPAVVTTSQRAELEPSDNTGQDNEVKVESEIRRESKKGGAGKGGKKKKGGKVDAKKKNKYGSSEVNS